MRKITAGAVASAAIAAANLFTIAAPASAQTWMTWRTGTNTGQAAHLPRVDRMDGLYTSYFASGTVSTTDMRYNTDRRSSASERVSLRWNGNSSNDDYVAGVGWAPNDSANKTRTISYRVHKFAKTSNDNPSSGFAVAGAYGWLCPELGGGSQRVEYYVVDSWLAFNSSGRPTRFRPYQGESRGSVTISGNGYDLFATPTVHRGHGCGAGNADFIQLWAVRQSQTNSTTATRSIDMGTFFGAWSGKKLVNADGSASSTDISVAANPGYQIIGVEGFGETRGELDVTVDR